MWLLEISSCSCLIALPVPAWVLLSKICILFRRSLYVFGPSGLKDYSSATQQILPSGNLACVTVTQGRRPAAELDGGGQVVQPVGDRRRGEDQGGREEDGPGDQHGWRRRSRRWRGGGFRKSLGGGGGDKRAKVWVERARLYFLPPVCLTHLRRIGTRDTAAFS